MSSDQVPASALQFQAELEIVPQSGEDSKSAPFRIKARSGDAIDHFWWGRVVHDLSGMQHKGRIPIDFNHDPSDIVGYANRFNTESGDLEISGALTPFKDSDRATEIIFKHGEGVPWEASINFGGDGILVEKLQEGEQETINGREFAGPLTVIRQWPLRGVAITPYGQDANTSVALSQDARIPITYVTKGKAEMSTDTNTKTPESDKAELAVDPQTENDSPETDEDRKLEAPPVVDGEAVERNANLSVQAAEVPGQKFMDAFGEQVGAVYFAKGIPFDEAMAQEIKRLREANTELAKRIDTQANDGADGALAFSDATVQPEDGKDAEGRLTRIPIQLQE